jgi:hypothetical protein
MTKPKRVLPTVADVERQAPAVAKWVSENVGPDVPALIKRGRPKKDEKVEPMVVKSVKVRPSVWKRLESMARKHGQTVNAFVVGELEALTKRH